MLALASTKATTHKKNSSANDSIKAPEPPKSEKPTRHPFTKKDTSLKTTLSPLLLSKKHDFSHLHTNRLAADLSAQLSCLLQPSGQWVLNLTNIQGSKVAYLLGRELTKGEYVSLDSLIPEKHRTAHHHQVEQILNEGAKSPYWESLFTGKMLGTLKITSPFQACPREINSYMTPSAIIPANGYLFDVTFVDQTVAHLVASKAAGITHDLRGFLRSALTLITELIAINEAPLLSSEECLQLSLQELQGHYQKGQTHKINQHEKITHVITLLQDALTMCESSHKDFLPDAFITKIHSRLVEAKHLLPVDEQLTAFIENLRQCQLSLKYPTVHLSLSAHSLQSLPREKIATLERFLLNLIKNAAEATATQIDVTCFSIATPEQLLCEVTDNGSGLQEPLFSTFFNRSITKSAKIPNDIEAKRGEGTLLAYTAWESIGGAAIACKRQDGATGTTFRLQLPMNPLTFFKPTDLKRPLHLTPQQMLTLQRLTNTTAWQGILLLVDDHVINLKLLMRNITEKIAPHFQQRHNQLNQVSQSNWQDQAISIDIMDQWAIICAANGDMAYEIIKNNPVSALITDQHMPGTRMGSDLIAAVRALEQDTKVTPIKIALNSGDTLTATEHGLFSSLAVTCVVKGETRVLSEFIHTMISATRATVPSVNLCQASLKG